MAELLIDKGGVPVDPKDKRERRPLQYAAYGNHADLVRLLLARGADVNAADKEHYTGNCFKIWATRLVYIIGNVH